MDVFEAMCTDREGDRRHAMALERLRSENRCKELRAQADLLDARTRNRPMMAMQRVCIFAWLVGVGIVTLGAAVAVVLVVR